MKTTIKRLPRSARFDARISGRMKSLFMQAAQIKGITETDFVINSALQEAEKIIFENKVLALSEKDSKHFALRILKKSAPNKKLKAAADGYKKAIKAEP